MTPEESTKGKKSLYSILLIILKILKRDESHTWERSPWNESISNMIGMDFSFMKNNGLMFN